MRLLHVTPTDVQELAGEGGMLGRQPAPAPARAVRAIAAEEAQALLASARERFGRPAVVEGRRGPAEREVLEACTRADLLILMRDGELRLGPKSLGRAARFVVDHAPCQVVLGWPASPPSVESIRLPSHLSE